MPTTTTETPAERVNAFRDRHGLTWRQVGIIAGVHEITAGNWGRGTAAPPASALIAFERWERERSTTAAN